MEIFCHNEGDPGWQINGTLADYGRLTELEEGRGFAFKSLTLELSPPQYKRNVTVEVAGNNNTDIACVVIGHSEPGAYSRTMTILVAGIINACASFTIGFSK